MNSFVAKIIGESEYQKSPYLWASYSKRNEFWYEMYMSKFTKDRIRLLSKGKRTALYLVTFILILYTVGIGAGLIVSAFLPSFRIELPYYLGYVVTCGMGLVFILTGLRSIPVLSFLKETLQHD